MSVATDDLKQRQERIERLLAEDIRKAAAGSFRLLHVELVAQLVSKAVGGWLAEHIDDPDVLDDLAHRLEHLFRPGPTG
jgi:hypothetical protein